LVTIYPLLYKLKEKYPHAEILFITFSINKGFLEHNTAVVKIMYVRLTTNIFHIVQQLISLLIKVRKAKIDLVINFETRNNMAALFSFLTGAPKRIGLFNRYEKLLYHSAVFNDTSKHITQLYSSLTQEIDRSIEFQYCDFIGRMGREKENVERKLDELNIKTFFCVHPGTSNNFRGKRYKISYLAELCLLLIRRYHIAIVYTGSKHDARFIEGMMDLIPEKKLVFNFAGSLGIGEFIELVRKGSLFISNDTGPMHIAASLGINSVVFFGPTSPNRYGPLNKNALIFYKNKPCSPCVGVDYVNHPCRLGFDCMEFPPQLVFRRITEVFNYDQST